MRGFSRTWCLFSLLLLSACAEPRPQVAAYDFSHLLARGVSRGLPGMWLAVGTVDGIDWSGAAGFSNLDGTIEAEIDDAIHMASITKIFTAIAVLRLIDSGALSTDTLVVDVLPAGDLPPIPHIDEITVEQLLDHSSGIYGFNNDVEYLASLIGPEADQDRVWTPKELIALSAEGANEPFGLPGAGHFYSDTNYVLLGLIVEAVSGQTLKRVVTQSLLGPLGMAGTYYLTDYGAGPGAAPGRAARGYLKLSDELMSFMTVHDKFPRARPDLADTTAAGERVDAAAGLVTTAGNLHSFGRALFSGGLLEVPTQTWLLAIADSMDGAAEAERVGTLRAYRKPYGVLVTAEGDGAGGCNTLLAYHPETGVIVVALTNVHGNWFESDFFADEVVAEVVKVYRNGTVASRRAGF